MSDSTASGLSLGDDGLARCWWHGDDETYRAYHDNEWGRPVADDRRLFEKLCLEGFQSGLSWLTILRKRENFRSAFAGFDPARVAEFGDGDVARLMADAGIVRHRGKILSTINNAKRTLEVQQAFGSLAAYIWSFEPEPDERPARIDRTILSTLSQTAASTRLAKDLKKRGWTFVGPTTVYAFMQSMGLVNDHLQGCHIRGAVERERGRFARPVRPDSKEN